MPHLIPAQIDICALRCALTTRFWVSRYPCMKRRGLTLWSIEQFQINLIACYMINYTSHTGASRFALQRHERKHGNLKYHFSKDLTLKVTPNFETSQALCAVACSCAPSAVLRIYLQCCSAVRAGVLASIQDVTYPVKLCCSSHIPNIEV